VLTLAAWLHTIDPFLLRISGEFGVRWYGMAYLAGFVCAYATLLRLAKRGRIQLSPAQVTDLIFALVVGVVVGGRVGYAVFYKPSLFLTFSSSPPWWGMLALNQGGMASHGGMLGAVVAGVWFARRHKILALHVLDIITLTAPFGLFFGRVANFINGELLGRIVAQPGEPAPWWTVKFPQELLTRHAPALSLEQESRLTALVDSYRIRPDENSVVAIDRMIRAVQHGAHDTARQLAPLLAARHPSQLYQAFAEGIVLGASLWFIWRKPRKAGVVGAWFLLLYGALRIVTEFWRLPDDNLRVQRIWGMSRGQMLSAVMIVCGIVILTIILRRENHPVLGGWRKPRSVDA